MKDKIFSPLDEPWIKVITIGLREKIVSLKTFFAEAHTYRRLAGDTPEQDTAMLRLLISIVLTAFFRYNAKGVKEKLEDEEDVLARFGEFYSEGRFTNAIQNYLSVCNTRRVD